MEGVYKVIVSIKRINILLVDGQIRQVDTVLVDRGSISLSVLVVSIKDISCFTLKIVANQLHGTTVFYMTNSD